MANVYGYAMHPLLIVMLVLLGAGGLIAAGCAIHYSMNRRQYENGHNAPSVEQAGYMNEVRWRNFHGLFGGGGGTSGGKKDPRHHRAGDVERKAGFDASTPSTTATTPPLGVQRWDSTSDYQSSRY